MHGLLVNMGKIGCIQFISKLKNGTFTLMSSTSYSFGEYGKLSCPL